MGQFQGLGLTPQEWFVSCCCCSLLLPVVSTIKHLLGLFLLNSYWYIPRMDWQCVKLGILSCPCVCVCLDGYFTSGKGCWWSGLGNLQQYPVVGSCCHIILSDSDHLSTTPLAGSLDHFQFSAIPSPGQKLLDKQ